VLHSRENWLLDGFGSPDKEARRLAVSELKFLWEQDAGRILEALFRTGMKAVGYGLGSAESRLRPGVKRRLSLRPEFWEE
jgi:rhamnosyltransferase